MPPSVRASLSPACKITGVKEGFDDAAFGQGLLKSGLQDHRGQVPHGLAPSEATRFRQNIVHVALMRNMSSHNMALT